MAQALEQAGLLGEEKTEVRPEDERPDRCVLD
jgi:hypothetical protein